MVLGNAQRCGNPRQMNCFTCPKTHNSNNYKNGGERADGTTDNLVEFSKIAKPATTNGSNNPQREHNNQRLNQVYMERVSMAQEEIHVS